MKYTSVLAALALLAAISGTQAQAQQEVDPTNYPLTPTVAQAAKQPVIHSGKGNQAHNTQHATVKKTQKSASGSAHKATIKTVSKR